MFQLVDIRYVCLVHFLLHDTPERIVNCIQVQRVQRLQIRWYEMVSVRTKHNSLTDVICYVTSGKGLTRGEHVIHYTMHELFQNKVHQKLYKYLNT